MKIATWNVERLKHYSQLDSIVSILDDINADILVLTETDSRIELPQYRTKVETVTLFEIEPENYKASEKRVSIFSHYEIVNSYKAFDEYTSLCVELATDFGDLIVYGTIIGIYGNRNENFKQDLNSQLEDIRKLASRDNLCVIGDYNISFSDNYYFTIYGRETISDSFKKNKIDILTHELPQCIDHISISQMFNAEYEIQTFEWNQDKKLSDHMGVCVELIKTNK